MFDVRPRHCVSLIRQEPCESRRHSCKVIGYDDIVLRYVIFSPGPGGWWLGEVSLDDKGAVTLMDRRLLTGMYFHLFGCTTDFVYLDRFRDDASSRTSLSRQIRPRKFYGSRVAASRFVRPHRFDRRGNEANFNVGEVAL